MYEASQSLDLAGNAFISEIRAGANNLPTELWLLPAKNVAIKPAQEFRLVDYYEYRSNGMASGARKRIENTDMIQLRMPNPDDPLFGMPVFMAAGRATDIDRESGNWQKSRLQNKVASDLHVEVPDGTTPEQANEIRDRIAERQAGSQNAGKPLVTAGKVNLLSHSAVEMDFVNSRKSTWTEIAAVFGVPLAALGFTEDVNLANAEAMNKQLWHDTVIPQLELIKRQLNIQLASDFGDDVVFKYDLSNITALQENENEKLDKAIKLRSLGVPLSVINQRFDIGLDTDEIEGAEIAYIPSGLLPVGFGFDEPSAELTAEEKRLIKAMCYGDK
jgi:HK97 family phage portal protein